MKQIFKTYQPLILSFILFVVLCGLIYISANNFLKTQSDVYSAQNDVNALENKLKILDSNKSLTKSQLAKYNSLLSQLIPDQEDYFSILYALDQLSLKTGFIISQYTIQLSDVSPEKLVVIVQGDGDADAFLKFLQDYKFAGGRLITNESIQFTSGKLGQIQLALNFYNKKVDSSTGEMTSLSPKQIALMQQIMSKTSIIFNNEATASATYTTKSNPF